MAGQTSRTTPQTTIAYIAENILPVMNSLDKKVDVLALDVSYLKEDMKSSNEIVAMLRKELYGNGNPTEQPGLKAVVLSMKKWVDDRSSIEKLAIGGVILAVIGQIVTVIFVAMNI